MSLRPTRLLAAMAVLAALATGAGAVANPVNILIPGQSAFGVISVANEVDLVHFHAEVGWSIDIKIKSRAGQVPPLLPKVTKLDDPDGTSLLGTVPVKTAKSGVSVHAGKFIAAKTGDYVLGISGDAGTTGTWDMTTKGPKTIPLGTGQVASAAQEITIAFDADTGTVVQFQVKPGSGSALQPLIARVERPAGAGNVSLTAATRKTTAKKDTLSNLALADNGTYGFVFSGANNSTGTWAATMKVGKTPALDFSVDPPVDPGPAPAPSVLNVVANTFAIPASGTVAKSMTVNGSNFVTGATVAITAPSGTNGISNVQATFNSSISLSVTFDLADTASTGARTVTVTNPDLQTGAKVGAFTLTGPPSFLVTSVTPSTGSGAGGTRVLIQGTLFNSSATVTFGSVPAWAVNVVDAQNILCTVPPATTISKTAGTAVTVTVDNGSGSTSPLVNGFTYDADANGPVVESTVPAFGATGVATNNLKYVFVMNEPIAAGTVVPANFSFFKSGVNDVQAPLVPAVAVGVNPRLIVLQHNFPSGGTLSASSVHRINLSNTNVTDIAGNGFDSVNSTPSFVAPLWQGNFTTGTTTDSTKPTITTPTPAASALNVIVDVAPTLLFSEPVDPTTVAAAVTLKQGVIPITCDLDIDAACTTVTIYPRAKLMASTIYTIGVATTLKDLANNTLNTAFSSSFTTSPADTSAPVQALTVDALAQDMNGSGTYAAGQSNSGSPSGTGAATAFDAYLPLSGFTINLTFSDAGGSGVDVTTFTFTSSAAMGGVGAGQALGSFFTVTPLGATWTVDAGHAFAATANNITFTANVSDYAGNPATVKTLVVDVGDITRTIGNAAGTASTDRDPFNARQSWLLQFDQDIYTIAASAGGSGSHTKPITVTTTLSANGTSDFKEDLTLIGLNGAETGTNASTATNGSATGTNAIVQKLVKDAVRGHMNERWGITYAGVHGANSVDIEFLLEGETKAAGGTVTFSGWTSGSGFSMMTFTGDEQPNSSGGTIGRALLNSRNTSQEDDSNTGVNNGQNLGTFASHMIRVRMNDPASTTFPLTFDPLITTNTRGGTPVGTSNLDAIILGGSFVYASGTAPEKARYDIVFTAIDRYALYLTATGAHEIGHSTGLVPDQAPPVGLFGNAHPNNTFIDNSGNYTSPNHIDTFGPNLMEAASSFDEGIATGSSFDTFGPMILQHLLRRLIYDQ